MSTSQTSAVRDLEAYAQFMSERTARSLILLRAIESTVVAVGTIRDESRSSHRTLSEILDGLKDFKAPMPEDLIDVYEEIQGHLAKLHGRMQGGLVSAQSDNQLRDEDGVCDIYREALSAVHDLHDCIEVLRWNLMQHNAALDQSDAGKELTTAKEVEEFLASL